jgi:DHA1 family tetracycline resistance protein-like MFS transporter
LARHPFVTTLKNLRGNARGCVLTEPLWGIPFNLYAPYASVYMLAFGISDSQIGLIVSLGMVVEILSTALSGAITDKLGRRRTTLIFDLISWSVPCLIWGLAQNITYFIVAAAINGLWRVVHNSWQCLLVEDTDPRLLVDIWSWIQVAGLLAAFVSPLTGLLIDRFSLVPTIRGLYLLAFVMMTAKCLTTNAMVTETQQGRIRMQETRDQPLFAVLRGYPAALKQIVKTPATLLTAGLMLIASIYMLVRGTFWSILVTKQIQIPAEHLALYPFVRSIAMLLFVFLVMPRLRTVDVRKPMLLGFAGLIVSHVILISVPVKNYALLLVSTVLEACSLTVVSTLLQKLTVIAVDAQDRARILAVMSTITLTFTAPFGWIAGRISEVNRTLPFVLNIVLFAIGVLLIWMTSRLVIGETESEETAAEEAAEMLPA